MNKTAFNFLIEKLREKNFHAGKNKFLTLAGRTTLIKSTLCSIPIHIMQIFKLPESILQQLDKLSRNFLWGSSDHKRKIHLVKWSTVIKSYPNGGLGIPSAKYRNQALLMSLAGR